MSSNEPDEQAEALYREALQYNWRSGDAGSSAALARGLFERSAAMKHQKALREFAEMLFTGSGGSQEPERALRLKWHAASLGDLEAWKNFPHFLLAMLSR